MTGQVPPAIRRGRAKGSGPATSNPSSLPSAVALIPLRYLARKLKPLAYQLGYLDGWDDAIAHPRRKARR